MSLEPQIAELKRLGFAVIDQAPDRVDAIRCRWHPDLLMTQVTALVRVRSQPVVDAKQVLADRHQLVTLMDRHDPSMLPRGFQKARVSVVAYLCDDGAGAIEIAEQPPMLAFAAFHAAGVRDRTGIHAYEGTRMWGALYYPLLRFLVRAMLEPADAPEPRSWAGIALMAVLAIAIVVPAALFAFGP